MTSLVSDEFLKNESENGKETQEEHPFSTSFEENSPKITESQDDTSVPTLFHEQFNKLRKQETTEADELKISLTNLCGGDDDKSGLNSEWAADGELR